MQIVHKVNNRPENVEIGALPFILPAGVAVTKPSRKPATAFHQRQQTRFQRLLIGAVIMDYTHE